MKFTRNHLFYILSPSPWDPAEEGPWCFARFALIFCISSIIAASLFIFGGSRSSTENSSIHEIQKRKINCLTECEKVDLHTLCSSLLHLPTFLFAHYFFSPLLTFFRLSGKRRERGGSVGRGKVQRMCSIYLLPFRNNWYAFARMRSSCTLQLFWVNENVALVFQKSNKQFRLNEE